MAVSLVQQGTFANHQAAGTAAVTLTGVNAGSAIIFIVAYKDNGNVSSVPSGVSDGTSYVQDISSVQGHGSIGIYSLFNVSAGSHTITATKAASATAANCNWTVQALEISGVPSTNSLDINVGNSQSSATPTVTTGVLASTNEIVIVAAQEGAATTGWVTPTSFISLGLGPSPFFPSASYAYILPAATTSLSPTFGTTTGSSYSAVAASYKGTPSGGGGAGPTGVGIPTVTRKKYIFYDNYYPR